MKIQNYFKYFPKSFDIEIDSKIVKSIKDANELNGSNKQMTVEFTPTIGKTFIFRQTGPSWDDSMFIFINNIEFFSNEKKYSEGIFKTLLELNNHDPHKCPVLISAMYFDFNHFHSLKNSTLLTTNNTKNSWIQVEFTQGLVVIGGFRLEKSEQSKLKSFQVICKDDISKSTDLWTILLEVNETDKNEHKDIDIYKFNRLSPPVRFIRLIQTGPNWDNDFFLQLCHMDFFGCYI